MTAAALAGIGFGALHAVTGPDHVLSLVPEAVARPRGAWRAGLSWGAGHGLATAVWFALAALVASGIDGERMAAASDRIAGAALALMGAFAIVRSLRSRQAPVGPSHARNSFLVGTIHGFTGAAALLLLLPAVAAEGMTRAGWIAGFAAGSAIAMAGLTAALAAAGKRIPARALRLAPPVAGAVSIAVGAAWAIL